MTDQLASCRAPPLPRPDPSPLPELPTPPQFPDDILLLIGLPGGGTTWITEAMEATLGGVMLADMFHPFCHEALRPEMSLVLGAPEDQSFVNIFRRVRPPRDESTDELARLVSW